MSGVAPGSPVSAGNSNGAWIAKNGDDSTIGRLDLSNTLPASGAAIQNIQRELNADASFMGKSTNVAENTTPTYSNNQGFTAGESLKNRTDAISGKFHDSTGHGHTGTPGDGPQIPAYTIINTVLKGIGIQGTNLIGVTGGSTIVTTELTGKTPSTSQTVKGVVVNAPYNKVLIRNTDGNTIEDGSGNVVYGRVTESVGVWTLTYYVLIAGVETAYTFGSATDVVWYFQELVNPIADVGYVYSPMFFVPSDNATADVVDASETQAGKVSVGTQTFGGEKTLTESILRDKLSLVWQNDAATTGTDATMTNPTKTAVRLTNVSLVSIAMINSTQAGRMFIAANETGVDLTVKDQFGGDPTKQILTGTGNDLSWKQNATLIFSYDPTSQKWRICGGSGAGGNGFIQDTMANIMALARVAGQTYFATDELAFYGDNGTDIVPLDVIVDTEANIQSNYTYVTGKFYYATDNGHLYVYDGSTLIRLSLLVEDPGTAGLPGEVLTHDGSETAKFLQPYFGIPQYLRKSAISDELTTNTSTVYANGAAAPTTGTGGSPSATVTVSTTNPIRKTNSFLYTPGGLGDGYSDLTEGIERADYGQMFKIELDYQIASGTYTDGDLALFLLDTSDSNAKMILSPTHIIPNVSGQAKMICYFQMPVKAVGSALPTLRLCLHQVTSASGYTFRFEYKIQKVFDTGYAPISTDPKSFDTSAGVFIKAVTTDPTYGTIVRNVGMLAQKGGMTYITWEFEQSAAGTSGSGTYLIKLPYKMDLTKYGLLQSYVDSSFTLAARIEGDLTANFNGADYFTHSNLFIYDESTLYVASRSASSTYGFWTSAFGTFSQAGTTKYNLNLQYYTLGLSAQTQVISEYDGRVVAFRGSKTSDTQSLTANVTPIRFDTVSDTHGSWNTDTFTCKIAGKYLVNSKMNTSSGCNIYAYINGTQDAYVQNSYASQLLSGAAIVTLAVGDTLQLRANQSVSMQTDERTLDIMLLSGAQQILVGQKIEASYYAASNKTTGPTQPLDFDTKEFDSTGSLVTTGSSWKFTAPVTGTYLVSGSGSSATGEYAILYKNGSAYKAIGAIAVTNNGAGIFGCLIQLNVGDYIDIRASSSITANGGSMASSGVCNVAIKQVN